MEKTFFANKNNEPEFDVPVIPSPGTTSHDPNKQAGQD